ncbi:pre-mRNA-splicing factor syf2 [Oryza brachyantha]|uniref:Pre-mRNA-splicing factor SYF2 n=1 Tax=Oryza brachyantha TaxID=4533 RepID=J3MHJ7_ORYBR|nr:pre-mRNA-splicing factor syf2 [Oryza brachyantha]
MGKESALASASAPGKSRPECINSSNPYHECSDYCLRKIAEARERLEEEQRPPADRTVHPDCINASNPYHVCSEYCFKRIADAKSGLERAEQEPSDAAAARPEGDDDGDAQQEDAGAEDGYPQMTEKQKKLFELRLKMNEARKANQQAMVAEKKRMEPRTESRGVSKQKWLEDRKKKIGKLLDSNGLDMTKSYMLDTQETAEAKYKKWEKEPAPYGWDVFNQKTLYDAYKKRTKNIDVDMEAYNKAKEADPEFYRDASSLQYGKVSKVPEENIDRMVNELKERDEKRKAFSRRRKFHEDKDIDSINDRNEHFNKKVERAFGKYTLEIKNNLERGTALPD